MVEAANTDIVGRCGCGTVVWDGAVPRYEETIICPTCRLDNSVAPPLLYRLRWGMRQINKRRNLRCLKCSRRYGLSVALRMLGTNVLRLNRERRVVPHPYTPHRRCWPDGG